MGNASVSELNGTMQEESSGTPNDRDGESMATKTTTAAAMEHASFSSNTGATKKSEALNGGAMGENAGGPLITKNGSQSIDNVTVDDKVETMATAEDVVTEKSQDKAPESSYPTEAQTESNSAMELDKGEHLVKSSEENSNGKAFSSGTEGGTADQSASQDPTDTRCKSYDPQKMEVHAEQNPGPSCEGILNGEPGVIADQEKKSDESSSQNPSQDGKYEVNNNQSKDLPSNEAMDIDETELKEKTPNSPEDKGSPRTSVDNGGSENQANSGDADCNPTMKYPVFTVVYKVSSLGFLPISVLLR